MGFDQWLKTNPGLWWWQASGVEGLALALGIDVRRTDSKRGLSVVPSGAPLLDRLTLTENCRAYAHLHGLRPAESEILTRLRTVEIPDDLINRRADQLNESQRALTWLAMAQLAGASMVILIEPLSGASKKEIQRLRRVLHETAAVHRHIFVVASHHETAVQLGASAVPHSVVPGS